MKNRRTTTLAVAVATAAVLTGAAVAELLGLPHELPSFLYVNGTTSYDAATGLFVIESDKNRNFDIELDMEEVRTTVAKDPVYGRTFDAAFFLDADGNFVEGVEGDDVVITGGLDLDQDGTVDISGILVTGEIRDFGFMDGGEGDDLFDALVQVTGGLAADLFTNGVISIEQASASTFTGSFDESFDGDAVGKACGTFAPFCGDGVVDAGEACDDGNTEDGDGCNAICESEEKVCPDYSRHELYQMLWKAWKTGDWHTYKAKIRAWKECKDDDDDDGGHDGDDDDDGHYDGDDDDDDDNKKKSKKSKKSSKKSSHHDGDDDDDDE